MRLDDGQIEVMDPAMVEVQRRMTTWQRLAVGFGMWDYTRKRVTAAVRNTRTGTRPLFSGKSRGDCSANQTEPFEQPAGVPGHSTAS